MTSIKHRIYRMLTSRTVIIGINSLLAYFALVVLCELWLDVRGDTLDLQALEKIIEGLAVLTISYGVALECRKDLQEIFGLYPAFLTEKEKRIDQVCHDFGVGLLLFGLFMEIPNQAVKIPDFLVNTHGIELRILLLAVPFVLATLIAGLLANWRLIRLPPLRDEH
jgi:hypothetical protein